MGDQVNIKVECYSGSAYAERPLALWWQSERIKITRILNETRSPVGKTFEVVLEDDRKVLLTYIEESDLWLADRLT